jgi:hypothetical protein
MRCSVIFCVAYQQQTTTYAREDERAGLDERVGRATFKCTFSIALLGLFRWAFQRVQISNFPDGRTTLLAIIRICIIMSCELKSTI